MSTWSIDPPFSLPVQHCRMERKESRRVLPFRRLYRHIGCGLYNAYEKPLGGFQISAATDPTTSPRLEWTGRPASSEIPRTAPAAAYDARYPPSSTFRAI